MVVRILSILRSFIVEQSLHVLLLGFLSDNPLEQVQLNGIIPAQTKVGGVGGFEPASAAGLFSNLTIVIERKRELPHQNERK